MADEMITKSTTSVEFEIDTTIEDLLGKLMTGALTPSEEARYKHLLAHRSRLMRPTISGKLRRRAFA
jgi:hypothetical protein